MKNVICCASLLISLLLSSCMRKETATKVFGLEKIDEEPITITSVVVQENQIILLGSGLNNVANLKITGPSGFNEYFSIESQTRGTLVANSVQDISFAVGGVFTIIASNDYAIAFFPLTFTITDEVVDSSSFDDMGAETGQVLKFNGTNWIPTDLDGLTYVGTWNANTNNPDLYVGGNIGDFFIVSTAGNTNLSGGEGTDLWEAGDWVVWNNVLSRWEKISNTGKVRSFNGRVGGITPLIGDYTWDQIDKSTSYISDIADVDNSAPDLDYVFAWDGSTWIPTDLDVLGFGTTQDSLDESSEVIVGTITMSDIFSATPGVVGSPSISFGDASGSGIYSPSVNEIAFTIDETESMRIDDSGNIGIGSTAPAAEMDVNGTVRAEEICDESGSNCRDLTFGLSDSHSLDADDGNPMDVVFVKSDGNVGVGTTIPNSSLHVKGSDAILKIEDTSDGISLIDREMAGVELITSSFDNTTKIYGSGVKFLSSDPQLTTENPKFLAGIIPRATQDYSDASKGGMALDFYTTPNDPGSSSIPLQRVTIDESGNVGIGTTVPIEKIQVGGSVSFNELAAVVTATSGLGKLFVKTFDSKLYFMDDGGTELNLITGRGGSNYSLDAVDGAPTEALYVDSEGNVGIGVTSAYEKLHVDGDVFVTGQKIWVGHDGSPGGGDNDGIVFDGASDFGSGSSGVFIFVADSDRNPTYDSPSAGISARGGYFTGNVGIDSTAAAERIHINGDIYVEGKDLLFGHDGASNIDNDGIFYDDNSFMNSGGVFVFNADSSRTIDPNEPSGMISVHGAYVSGNVGISVIAPTEMFEVDGTVASQYYLGDGSKLAGIPVGTASAVNTGSTTIGADDEAVPDGNGDIELQIANTTEMIIQNDGNVGIGNTAPYETLHVQGEIFVEGKDIWFDSDSLLDVDNDGIVYDETDHLYSDGVFIFVADQDRGTKDYTTPTAAISAKSGYFKNNVGIGTIAPAYHIDVVGDIRAQEGELHGGNDDNDYIDIIDNTAIRFYTQGLERFTILNSGNIGIGSTNPQSTLDVSGDIRAVEICNASGEACYNFDKERVDDHSLDAFDGGPGNALYVDAAGNVGIDDGATGPFGYNLYVDGTAGMLGGGDWINHSDERLKKNVETINSEEALAKIIELRGVSFNWINPQEHKNGIDYSLVAQELENVFPEWVIEIHPSGDDKNLVDDKIKAINFPHSWKAYLVEAFQGFYGKVISLFGEQRTTNTELNEQIVFLIEENAIIRNENNQMKKFICVKLPDAPFCREYDNEE